MGIGKKLAKLLESKGTNANELSRTLSISAQTIYSMIKRDSKKADIEVLIKISDYFGVTPEYFITGECKTPSSIILTKPEEHLLDTYRDLNEEGQEKVSDYADDLAASGRYKKNDEHQMVEEETE